MLSELRYACRQLAKTPGFTAIAVVTLAIGIGASTAMFSVLRALVLEPFQYPQSDRIVHVWSNEGQPLSTPDYIDLRDRATSFAEFGAYTPRSSNLGGDHPQTVTSLSATPGVLRTFGVRPQLGRWLEADDEKPGAPAVVVISHRLWLTAFGGDPALVGRTIRVNAAPATVVGIMPASFEFVSPWLRTESCDVWMPLGARRGEGDRGSHWMCAVGRLKAGVTGAAANAEIKAIGTQLAAAYPNTNTHKPFLVRSLKEEMTRWGRSRTWMLFGAVSLLLLVACANVASMLLARSARRQSEFGVRIALGAGRGRIVRLALAESVLLAAGGGLAGVLIAYAGCHWLAATSPVGEARRAAIALDPVVLGFALGASGLTALLAGLPPALAAGRIAVTDLLRSDSRGATGSRTRHRLLRTLIVAQVAIALMLANGAALFSNGYLRLRAANQSLSTDRVLSAEFSVRSSRYESDRARTELWSQIAARAAALPGVTAAGLISKLPLEGGSNMNILVDDQQFDPLAERVLSEVSAITPGYFAAAGIPLLRGRTLEPRDAGSDQIGVVVNRALAEKCWPGKDPLGQVIRPSMANAWFHARVVGVVENVRQWGAESEPRPEMFWTPDHAWGTRVYLLVRSSQPAAALGTAIRREMLALDPDLPASNLRTLATVVDDATQGQRAVMQLVDFFMAVALALVAIGLYGTLSYHVLQRTREIGVRMAIGATRRRIISLVLRQGSHWVLAGAVLGVAGAIGATLGLRSLVYGLTGVDAASLLLACVAIAGATAIACCLPAWRASRVDPIVALRSE